MCTVICSTRGLILKDFTFLPPHTFPPTCVLVAERLMTSVKEVTFRRVFHIFPSDIFRHSPCRRCVLAVDSSKSVLEAVVPVNNRLRMEERVVVNEKEVVEVVNSYLSIPVTSFHARKIEQVQLYEIPP